MHLVQSVLDLFLHLDRHLVQISSDYQTWTYLILYLIVFAETGLVVTPFLPGDSLLFAAGALSAVQGSPLHPALLFGVFLLAAFCGDNVNYFVGKFLGPRLFRGEQTRFLKREHLDRTHAFFEKYGGKAIIMARFVPIVRTFMPFTAGLGAMTYLRFLAYSLFGAVLWVGICVNAGYFLGGLEIVKNRFSLVVIVIVFLSVLPAVIEFLKHRRETASRAGIEPAIAAASEDS